MLSSGQVALLSLQRLYRRCSRVYDTVHMVLARPLRASRLSWRLPMREWQHAMLYRAACFSPLLIAGGLSL